MATAQEFDLLLVMTRMGNDLGAALAELDGVLAKLDAILAESAARPPRVCRASDVGAALDLLARGAAPRWIVVLQSWPGEILPADVDHLRRAAPLARIRAVVGSWCEGETRSGKPWPSVPRASWSHWAATLARELRDTAQDRASPWSLPATASAEEALLAAIDPRGPAPSIGDTSPGLLIVARERETREALADAAAARGYRARAIASPADWSKSFAASDASAEPRSWNPGAILWDTTPAVVGDRNIVERVSRAAAGAPVLAMVGFPRADDARAREAGVAALVAKPYLLDDLFWRVEQVSDRA